MMDGDQLASNTASMQERDSLAHLLKFSFGSNSCDNRPRSCTLTFGDLIQEFAAPDTSRGTLSAAEYHALDKSDSAQKKQRDREKDGPYFAACHFGGNGRRCNENVETLCGFVLDFDSGKTTKEDICRVLDGYAYVAYTSYSHQDEHQRWRVVIPYREPIGREQHLSLIHI